MVGEVRDLETASIAMKAALTGHLVLSTLHTNSAPETVTRLLDMGIESFNVASAINLIVARSDWFRNSAFIAPKSTCPKKQSWRWRR